MPALWAWKFKIFEVCACYANFILVDLCLFEWHMPCPDPAQNPTPLNLYKTSLF